MGASAASFVRAPPSHPPRSLGLSKSPAWRSASLFVSARKRPTTCEPISASSRSPTVSSRSIAAWIAAMRALSAFRVSCCWSFLSAASSFR
jgi:hypothetical protein